MRTKETYFLKPLVLILVACACILSYFFFDLPITKHFEHISSSLKFAAKKISMLIDSDTQETLWPLLFFAFRFVWKKELLANRFLLLMLSIPITNFVMKLIKMLLGRARPELFFSSEQFGFTFFSTIDPLQSMPSGHACSIGAACGAFACFYPKATLPLVILALLLAFSRVILAEHYLGDIIAGVAIGFFMSQWIYSVMRKKNIQFTRR